MSIHKLASFILLTLLLFGCTGPAQGPAAPPTRLPTQSPTQPPTQPPTPTVPPPPTPIPYNLDLLVKDPDGRPIPSASVQLGGHTVQAGPSGTISFSDLGPGPLALAVSAPGYLTQELSPELHAGDNQIEVVLEPEPYAQTATPQPLPENRTGYDLTLTVTDLEGRPLSQASVSRLDAGGQPVGDLLTPNAAGVLVLNDLPTGVVSLAVSAPGYLPLEQGLIIEKGEPANLTLALERDTLGLDPVDACASDEEMLYIEDFNDGQAQGWQNISAAVESNTQNGWSILEQPSGNMLLQAANGLRSAIDELENGLFQDAVWRLKVYYTGDDTTGFINWRYSSVDESGAHGDWRYFLPFGGPRPLELIRLARADFTRAVQSDVHLTPDQWHLFEISTYQGVTEVWLDNHFLFSYTDPQPLPPGTIGLEMHLREEVKTVFWFDDLAVCGLSAPFVSLR